MCLYYFHYVTNYSTHIAFSGKSIKEASDLVAGVMPQGRIGEPEDIAKLIAFTVSEDNTYMIGHEIFVDGGAQLTSSFNMALLKYI